MAVCLTAVGLVGLIINWKSCASNSDLQSASIDMNDTEDEGGANARSGLQPICGWARTKMRRVGRLMHESSGLLEHLH